MKLETLADDCKGINITGIVSFTGDRKEKDGEFGKWHTQFIVVKDITGSVSDALTGKTIELESKNIRITFASASSSVPL